MSDRIGVIVIHGMGSQRPGFSAQLTERIAHRLGDRERHLEWQEIHWAHVLREHEDHLWDVMNGARDPSGALIPLDWRTLREFVIHNFGDALAYHRDTSDDSAYARIHAIISSKIADLKTALGDCSAPIVVLAHSLGAHVISNYLWDRQHGSKDDELESLPTLVSMITFGCNIPLFSLDFDTAEPIHLPGEGISGEALICASRWLNFIDRDDVLGWPLGPLYRAHYESLSTEQRATVDRIEDYEINVGGTATSWNPRSHTAYETDRDMIRSVARHFNKLFDCL